MYTDLTLSDTQKLEHCESVIGRGIAAFADVGNALLSIRDGRLYRATHATFDAYCRERWGFQKAYAYRLIASSKVIETLSPMGDIPDSERKARPLASLSPEEQPQAWKAAQEKADAEGRRVTSRDVEDEVEQRKQKDRKEDRPKKKGVALEHAANAIADLQKIPPKDALRRDAWQMVRAWLVNNE